MYQKLSPSPECPEYQDENMTYGLGYDSVSDDFKVVRAVVFPSTNDPTPVYVFTPKLSRVFTPKLSRGRGLKTLATLVLVMRPGLLWMGLALALLYTKDGEVEMVLNSKKLMIFNPKQNTYKRIEIPLDCECFTAASYLESLVSPRGCKGLIA
ncbi:hypothetical protein RHSIM_Rhsim04G0211300 [Rhododendron simsii]|uniref:Uncharacterized protein n=1 Tax=Rhododendron simsii TaxID=118357 RepID=A0A834LMG0_RHOSS|nr:hypothetical protein RHSIM_Rhsim04G0211300 [Rhododendron simsii]